jgi:hypothetical protein
MSLTFTIHPARQSLAIGKAAHKALVTDAEASILIFGTELSKEERDAITAMYATDGGKVVLSDDAPVSACKANVNYVMTKSKVKTSYRRITANTPDAPTVAYVVAVKKA